MLAHAYNIIIDCVVISPGNDKEVLDGLNDTEERLISMLMTTVQLPGAATYDN